MLDNVSQIYVTTLAQLPPVPSIVPILKTNVSTTTDETTSTFTGIDISVPHPKRIVIVSCHHGVAAAATATCNGIDAYHRTQNTAHEFSMFAFQVPNGTLATITISATGSVRKWIAVYIAYPKNHTPLDSGTGTANTTTNATVANVKVQSGGFLLACGGQNATLGAFSTTWGGPDAVIEDGDAQYESASSFTYTRIGSISVSSDANTVTLAETVSGTKRLVVTTWGPP